MPEGLITSPSRHAYAETVAKLEAAIAGKGLTLFARIDHAAAAEAVDLPLRPTLLLVFGNAKGGTPLMQAAQTIGIDLPLKLLVWEDERGVTSVSYNDPAWLAARHGLPVMQQVEMLSQVLGLIVKEAA